MRIILKKEDFFHSFFQKIKNEFFYLGNYRNYLVDSLELLKNEFSFCFIKTVD
ncbi:hypothetical protein LEP1GSC008_2403 [Leptospira kirschneri serovar Bulgarica str. Nikolaevo]|uniref:Uncharacterized protein n=1 Tax=Leptospira kirschneri serovar Bulgarica str. Nikolaevo TaxID=1240687 RepID=M6FI98_9LEPT|nr:hypothetical protein LEP1GSC008_2403 [Leptospira kirschneri serovar Bulgarica str. Nikolaevo]